MQSTHAVLSLMLMHEHPGNNAHDAKCHSKFMLSHPADEVQQLLPLTPALHAWSYE
jgi:hypothetical protein